MNQVFRWSNFSLPKSYWQAHIVNKTFHKYPSRDKYILPCPTENLHWSSHVWSTTAIGLKIPNLLQQRGFWTIYARRKYPLGEGFKHVVALTHSKDKQGKVHIALSSSPSMLSNPTQSMCWLQALHGNEAKVVDLLSPNPSAGHKTPSCLPTVCET